MLFPGITLKCDASYLVYTKPWGGHDIHLSDISSKIAIISGSTFLDMSICAFFCFILLLMEYVLVFWTVAQTKPTFETIL